MQHEVGRDFLDLEMAAPVPDAGAEVEGDAHVVQGNAGAKTDIYVKGRSEEGHNDDRY